MSFSAEARQACEEALDDDLQPAISQPALSQPASSQPDGPAEGEEPPQAHTPAARAVPHDARQVARLLAAALRHGVQLRSSGALPRPELGFGGCRTGPDDLQLDTSGLKQLILDRDSGTVRAGAGWTGAALARALKKEGFSLPPLTPEQRRWPLGSWAASGHATAPAEVNGTWEDGLVGLELALPNGELAWTGRSPRSAVGPDLRSWALGCRDQLGVITELKLRVRRTPERAVLLASFPRLTFGFLAARDLCRSGLVPADSMLIPASAPDRFRHVHQDRAKPLQGGMLGLIFEGAPGQAEAAVAEAARFVEARRGTVVDDPAASAAFLQQQVELLEAEGEAALDRVGQLAGDYDIGHIVAWAPWSRLELLVNGISSLTGGAVRAFAWYEDIGPGGACARLVFQSRSRYKPGHLFIHGLRQTLAVNGGRLAGHTLGATRARPEAAFFGRGAPAEGDQPGPLGLLAALKRTLDPKGLLNPGAFPQGQL